MSIELVTKRSDEYIGLSTDTKPTSSVPAGSIFYETDTRNLYIFDGTTWNRM